MHSLANSLCAQAASEALKAAASEAEAASESLVKGQVPSISSQTLRFLPVCHSVFLPFSYDITATALPLQVSLAAARSAVAAAKAKINDNSVTVRCFVWY